MFDSCIYWYTLLISGFSSPLKCSSRTLCSGAYNPVYCSPPPPPQPSLQNFQYNTPTPGKYSLLFIYHLIILSPLHRTVPTRPRHSMLINRIISYKSNSSGFPGPQLVRTLPGPARMAAASPAIHPTPMPPSPQ